MKIGDILYFPDFAFQNGGHADKLAIILEIKNDNALFILTTSKGKQKDSGCQPKSKKLFIKGGQYSFPHDTWLDLARTPYLYSLERIENLIQLGQIVCKDSLPEQIVREIRNCLIKHASSSLTKEMCEFLGVRPHW